MKPFLFKAGVTGLAAVLFAGGCALGPDYKRPQVDTPSSYRRAASDAAVDGTTSFADAGWWDTFEDPQLKAYVDEALRNSWDIKAAAARVLQAEAALGISRSRLFPTIGAGGELYTTRVTEKGPVPLSSGLSPQQDYGDVFLSMPSYELDLWGRIRRSNEAALAQLLATVEAQATVRQTLVFQVATAYIELLELDLELDIANRSYEVRKSSLELTRSREEGGVAAMQDVYQAQILVSTTEAAIANTHQRIEQQENYLAILLGRNPGSIQRGTPLIDHQPRGYVPVGLPSALLERRPDVRSSEQMLVAANAGIGEAKAAFFPQLSLTGLLGYRSNSLSELFSNPAKIWQFGPEVTAPIFTGGRLRGGLKQAKAYYEESLAGYQKTVQNAFREASDGLVAYQRTREFRTKQEERTQAHRSATGLANVRYEGGVTSYLEVLYNEQELFTAELNLAQARRNELLSVVQLYRALGGGWTEKPGEKTQAP